jgi:hypothetical protein
LKNRQRVQAGEVKNNRRTRTNMVLEDVFGYLEEEPQSILRTSEEVQEALSLGKGKAA